MSRAPSRAATAGLTRLATATATVTVTVTATVTIALTLVMTAAPAFAENPLGHSEGADPGKSIGTAAALLLYVGLPLLSLALIATVVLLPGVRAHRYRPSKGWNASPVWFAGPPEPVAAVQAAELGDVVRGGSSGGW